jgi:magnesium transporter
VWWLDVENPLERTLWDLCNTFLVHPLTVEDIWKQERRDKLEDFLSYAFVCFQSFHTIETNPHSSFEPYTIPISLLPEGTLSFRFTEGEYLTRVLHRIELLRDYATINSDWICYALM